MPRESHVVLCVVWMSDRKCAQHAKMNTCGQSLRANSLSPHTLSPGKHKLWLKYCSKGLLWIMYLIHLLSSSWPLYFGLWQRYLEQLGYFGNQARVVICYKSNPAVSGVKEIYLILAAWKPLWITEIVWGEGMAKVQGRPPDHTAPETDCCCCYCCIASVMSDSVIPHRQQPTRLPHPWYSPGKNTGVGCHFLLQCMKVKSESEFTQSCRTLPHGLQPTRLLCPWGFPGKSTGVGCHCLLQLLKQKGVHNYMAESLVRILPPFPAAQLKEHSFHCQEKAEFP